ncbi:MAG: C39 family peptidase [Candidatus Daviesbacteria bacterium]|nr:C39 family peptidase [Candidatus Daviesbacteria bacterium]
MFKLILILIPVLGVLFYMIFLSEDTQELISPTIIEQNIQKARQILPSPKILSPKINLQIPPQSKILTGGIHVFQTFNNCGPASLSMTLSYFDINVTQQELGQQLRPYHVRGGDNDDKSVTMEELAQKGEEYGLLAYHRPMGNLEMIKLFITYDIPVIARTWTKPNEDIGHYRVIKGYDGDTIIQDDSLQNKNLRFEVLEFNAMWDKFNFEYLVLVPKEKRDIAEAILDDNLDKSVAWKKALNASLDQLAKNPNSITDSFNLSVAYFNTGEFQKSVEEFEKVEDKLPFRALWYQIEPILSYYELGNYERVFQITEHVLNYYNRAFSELYLIRGHIYKNQGNYSLAQAEFEKAQFYNKNLQATKDALNSL